MLKTTHKSKNAFTPFGYRLLSLKFVVLLLLPGFISSHDFSFIILNVVTFRLLTKYFIEPVAKKRQGKSTQQRGVCIPRKARKIKERQNHKGIAIARFLSCFLIYCRSALANGLATPQKFWI